MEQERWMRGGLNTDDSVEVMSPDDWYYAANVISGKSAQGRNGEIENIRGTTSILSLYTNNNSRLIGVISSAQDNLSYLFFYNSDPSLHCILKLQNDSVSLVLRWSGLNFQNSKQYRINGGGIAGDLLYFTDNYNQPRCVHISRYATGNVPANHEEIFHIRRGPQFPPECLTIGNIFQPKKYIADVQFAMQYEYVDGQLSVLSPYTSLIRSSGHENVIGVLENVTLRIGTKEHIPSLVKKIKFIAKRNNTGTPFYIGEMERPFDPSFYSLLYTEQNLGPVEIGYDKQFENVPLKAKTACISKSRMWFGNFIEGYDTPAPGQVNLEYTLAENNDIIAIGPCFSPNSKFRLGIVFHDDQGRSSGVIDNGWTLKTETEILRGSKKLTLRYRIFGTPPAWAKYYSFVITKDLNKTFFLQSFGVSNAGSEIYVSVANNGSESYSTNYSGTTRYLRLSLSVLNQNGVGYAFKEGDYVIVTKLTGGLNTNFSPLKVMKIVGDYVYVEGANLGNGGFQYNYQIYTPNNGYESLYYEIGQRREIVSGTLDTAYYFYSGDCLNVNTTPWQGTPNFMPQMRVKIPEGPWNVDIGKGYVKSERGQVLKKNFFKHSATFIAGVNVNGLSEFNAGDEGSVPIEAVSVQKLQATTKQSVEGDVILAICNSDTYSIYVDEARMSSGDGQSFLIASSKVIGDVRKQKTGYGTIHPESVLEVDGYVYVYDKLSRSFLRYASNGMFPISEYKVANYYENQSLINGENDPVISGYDPFYQVVFVTFKNAQTSTKRTIGFSIPKERWISFYDFAPDGYVVGSDKMYSVVRGSIYRHDGLMYTHFYDTEYRSTISASFNDHPAHIKEWLALQVQCSGNMFEYNNTIQGFGGSMLDATLSNLSTIPQVTDIRPSEFEVVEGVAYGEIRGDLNSPGGIVEGSPLFSSTLQCSVSFMGRAYRQLKCLKVGYEIARGHKL
jgi:hypothetical protein